MNTERSGPACGMAEAAGGRGRPTRRTLDELATDHLRWAAATFDAVDRRPVAERIRSGLRHAAKELAEIAADPQDAVEFVDVIGLMVTTARLAGHSLDDLAAAWERKLEELPSRRWARGADGTIEHVRTGAA